MKFIPKNKYNDYVKPRLDEITDWISQGCIYKQVAANLGINVSSFYSYINEHGELFEAIKKGKTRQVDIVEDALLKAAKGFTYIEEVEELRDGVMKVVKRQKKTVPPNLGAIAFFLKNRAPDLWKDRSVLDVEEGGVIPKVEVVVKDLSDGGAE